MIKGNELRVGSLIQCKLFTDGEWKTIKVTGVEEWPSGRTFISWHSKGCCPADMILLNESYKPIPLTEEWLERMGFEQHEAINSDGDEIICWRHRIDHGLQWRLGRLFDDYNEISYIKNIHQLQNLYFAMTGEELKIDL